MIVTVEFNLKNMPKDLAELYPDLSVKQLPTGAYFFNHAIGEGDMVQLINGCTDRKVVSKCEYAVPGTSNAVHAFDNPFQITERLPGVAKDDLEFLIAAAPISTRDELDYAHRYLGSLRAEISYRYWNSDYPNPDKTGILYLGYILNVTAKPTPNGTVVDEIFGVGSVF